MRRLTVDHQAGKLGRDAVLTDEAGNHVLRLSGGWAVTDDDGRTILFLAPDFRGIVTSAIVGGVVEGILGGVAGSSPNARSAGPGGQTVKRARPPVRGMPPRWTPVATVSRERTSAGEPTAYTVEMQETLPPVRFVQTIPAAALVDYANGYGDRREGVFDLLHADGRPILRHWATIDAKLTLRASTFDVEDADYPLAEAVALCLARWWAWRS